MHNYKILLNMNFIESIENLSDTNSYADLLIFASFKILT